MFFIIIKSCKYIKQQLWAVFYCSFRHFLAYFLTVHNFSVLRFFQLNYRFMILGLLRAFSKACFTSNHHTFVLQSIQGQTCHGCINHDMPVGLCSELLMRLSYHIHQAFGKKKIRLTWKSNPSPFDRGSSTLPLDQSGNFCFQSINNIIII